MVVNCNSKLDGRCERQKDKKYLIFQDSGISVVRNAETLYRFEVCGYSQEIEQSSLDEIVLKPDEERYIFSGENVLAAVIQVDYETEDDSDMYTLYVNNGWKYNSSSNEYENQRLSEQDWNIMGEIMFLDAPNKKFSYSDLKIKNPNSKNIRIYSLYVKTT